jgi:DnaJ-class molecular chaperone
MNNTRDAIPPFGAAHGSAAEVESEVCSSCEGYGSISYNPNLNPNAFPATASAKCTHCGGTGRVEQAKPQPNAGTHPLRAGDEQPKH